MIRLLAQSVADTAIVPMQDVLGLGGETRMNTPGRPDGNWEWRMCGDEAVHRTAMERLAEITFATGRTPVRSTPPDSAAASGRPAQFT
jgi:4-alpha-glucanotransferase